MPLTSLLRSRRTARHKAEVTQQVIAFQLQQNWFALPIQSVQKVVPLGAVYGDPKGQGTCLTVYQERELLVVDVGHRIFGDELTVDGLQPEPATRQHYLVVVQNRAGELVGVPIASPPVLKRVPDSAMTPLPETYLASGIIGCLSPMMIHLENEPAMFLLDPEQLYLDR